MLRNRIHRHRLVSITRGVGGRGGCGGCVCVGRCRADRGPYRNAGDPCRRHRPPAPSAAVVTAGAVILIDHRWRMVGSTIDGGAAVMIAVGVSSIAAGRRPMSVIRCDSSAGLDPVA